MSGTRVLTGARIWMPRSPLRTCRPSWRHAAYPATWVASGRCAAIAAATGRASSLASRRNACCCIAAQRPDATHVAGYAAWRQLGRQVRKGERGIQILAPVSTRVPDIDPERTAATTTADGKTEPTRRVLRGFRVAHVFDVAQTDGPPLPEVQARLLDGAAPNGLWEGLADQVAAAGFSLVRGDCAPANGVTDHLNHTVTVATVLSDAQAVKTLAHELAHARLHGPNRPDGMDRARAEVEAESVAYLVTTAHGLDPSDYTVPYVAGWSGGDLAVLRSTAERVLETAGDILATSGQPQPSRLPMSPP